MKFMLIGVSLLMLSRTVCKPSMEVLLPVSSTSAAPSLSPQKDAS